MEATAGRKFIAELLEAVYKGEDLVPVLDRTYPGGMEALQTGWETWLKQPRKNHRWTMLR